MNAYAHYDPEIQYCQGMNIVMSWILKFMVDGTGQYDEEGHEILAYDEVSSFYIFLYMMNNLQYRNVYDEQLSKLNEHLEIIEEHLHTSFPEIYNHLVDEMFVNLVPVFTNIITTIFVADLQQSSPRIACHIFDVFLIDGEKVVFTLLMKFLSLKEDKILELIDDDLLRYMKTKLPIECLTENAMDELFDFNATIEWMH